MRDEIEQAQRSTESQVTAPPDELPAFDVQSHQRQVGPLPDRVSTAVRAGHRARDRKGRPRRRHLRRTALRGASLRGPYLIGADLRGADLSATDLLGADLRAADVRGARLADALPGRPSDASPMKKWSQGVISPLWRCAEYLRTG
jgi:hypothetical protein